MLMFILIVATSVSAETITKEKSMTVMINDDSILITLDGSNYLYQKNVSSTHTEKFNITLEQEEVVTGLDSDTILNMSNTISKSVISGINSTDNSSEVLLKKVIERHDKLEHNVITATKVAVDEYCDFEILHSSLLGNLSENWIVQEEYLKEKAEMEKEIMEENNKKSECLEDLNVVEETKKHYLYMMFFLAGIVILILIIVFKKNTPMSKKIKEKAHSIGSGDPLRLNKEK